MWTRDTRAEHDRDDLRYHLTDAEWQVLAPLFPPPATTGRRRAWPMREQINVMFFMLRGGILWRMLPTHFPPHQTVSRWVHPLPRRGCRGSTSEAPRRRGASDSMQLPNFMAPQQAFRDGLLLGAIYGCGGARRHVGRLVAWLIAGRRGQDSCTGGRRVGCCCRCRCHIRGCRRCRNTSAES